VIITNATYTTIEIYCRSYVQPAG